MSDSQSQSYPPAQTPRRRGTSVIVWFVVLVIAVGAFAAAVVWAGGIGPVQQLVSSALVGAPKTSTPVGAPTTVPPKVAASALPTSAQEQMFSEMVDDRQPLTDLVDGKIASFTFGTASAGETTATVPVTAVYKNGRSITGDIMLAKYNGSWYFFSIGTLSPDSRPDRTAVPTAFDSGVVSAITQQQALPGTQELITGGLIGGGYREAKVGVTSTGLRTATVDVTLSGGSEQPSKAHFLLISKTDAGTTYWFVARFEKL